MSQFIELDFEYAALGVSLRAIRLDPSLSLGAVKEKIKMKVGVEPADMELQLQMPDGGAESIFALADDAATLASVGALTGMKVVVTSRADAAFDASAAAVVEKVTISDEAYAARGNNVRSFKAGMPKKKKAPPATDETGAAAGAALLGALGRRVRLSKSGAEGTLRFVGGSGGEDNCLGAAAEKLPKGWWAGVELDGGAGKHDGEVNGERLFSCAAGNSGAMVRPEGLEVLEAMEEGAGGGGAGAEVGGEDDEPDEM